MFQVAEKNKTQVSCPIIFSLENHAVCEIMWKNMAGTDSPRMT